MALAWTIGKFFNIPIRLHYSMLLLLFTFDWIPGSGAEQFLTWAAFMGLIFGSILLHEIGHALAARRYGIQTHDIVLTPIGGIARLAGMPKNPKQEIIIAIAGPAVSFALFVILFFGAGFLATFGAPLLLVYVLGQLAFVNQILGVFNLIPALPMDGGRVLRGFLALKYDHLTATRKAARFARVLAVSGGGFALIGSSMGYFPFRWTYLFIPAFVYLTAGMELRMAQLRAYQEQAARSGEGPFGPFGSTHQGTYTRSGTFTHSPFGQTVNPGSARDKYAPNRSTSDDDWEVKTKGPNDVVVVKGGKAEILSRHDPDTKKS